MAQEVTQEMETGVSATDSSCCYPSSVDSVRNELDLTVNFVRARNEENEYIYICSAVSLSLLLLETTTH